MIDRFCQDCNKQRSDASWSDYFRTRLCVDCYNGRCDVVAKSDPELDVSVVLQPDGYFCAIDRNNYDVDCDHTGYFTRSPQGCGRTPLDAIVDLLDNMAEG
jgi:hypothetical protein